MARASRKPPSKRRAAALKFLSSISFESNALPQEDPIEQTVRIEEKICLSPLRQCLISNEKIFEEFVSSKFVETEFMASVSAPFRERSNTASCDVRMTTLKQRKVATVEEIPPAASFSSTESIHSGYGKQRLDLSHRLQKFKEVKITSASNLKNCKNERIMLVSSSTKIPFYVFSFLPYKKIKSKGDSKKDGGSRRRNLSGSRPLSSFIDTLDPFMLLGLEKFENGQMISYQQLLLPSLSEQQENKEQTYQEPPEQLPENSVKNIHIPQCISADLGASTKSIVPSSSPPFTEIRTSDLEEYGFGSAFHVPYSPFLLDDPELMSGKHRTVLTFPSYRASIIDYVRPSELKKELNEKFKEKFPHIQLTLSKLRSLKKEMKSISKTEKCVDLLTVAQSYVYFEKLILRNVINKTNRKICAAVCLLLSSKMNDIKGIALKHLLEKLESIFRLSRKDILALEFPAVVALEFSLHVPTWEVLPHFQRLTYES